MSFFMLLCPRQLELNKELAGFSDDSWLNQLSNILLYNTGYVFVCLELHVSMGWNGETMFAVMRPQDTKHVK